MRRLLLFLVLPALLLPGCARGPSRGEPDQVSSDEWTLEPGSFYQPTFEARGKAHVRAHVQVLEGEPIDAFLASGSGCLDYPTEDFRPASSALSTVNGTMEMDFDGGRACLILDNHDFPPGTSAGNATARVAYRIEMWE